MTLFPILWASAYLNTNPDVFLWENIRPLDPLPDGYRERYANVQAALGLEALKHLDSWTADTQAHAAEVHAGVWRTCPGARLPRVPRGSHARVLPVLRLLSRSRRDRAERA